MTQWWGGQSGFLGPPPPSVWEGRAVLQQGWEQGVALMGPSR